MTATAHARRLYDAGDLLYQWTARNVRARYQQSALGWLWAILMPTAQALTFTAVFTIVVPIDTGPVPYVLFSYVAIVPWTLLSAALPDMANSVVENMSLVTKIYFPREVLPIAALAARLMDAGVAAALALVLFAWAGAPVFGPTWIALPLLVAIQLLLLLGAGLACAALNVLFRDVRAVLVLGIQIWFYATPVVYPVEMVPEQYRAFYFLNPMAGVVVGYRDVLLDGSWPGAYLASSAAAAVLIFVLGCVLFKRIEPRFSDVI